MGDMSVKLPEELTEFVEAQVGQDGFASPDAYVAELIRRDHDRRLEELRKIVAEGLASGVSTKTFEERIAEGNRIARERGLLRD